MAEPALSEADTVAVRLGAVTKVYDNGVTALGPLDLDVKRGEFVSLLGPSGCGKSTALRLIAGLTAPSSGVLRVSHRSGEARAGHSIGPRHLPVSQNRFSYRVRRKIISHHIKLTVPPPFHKISYYSMID